MACTEIGCIIGWLPLLAQLFQDSRFPGNFPEVINDMMLGEFKQPACEIGHILEGLLFLPYLDKNFLHHFFSRGFTSQVKKSCFIYFILVAFKQLGKSGPVTFCHQVDQILFIM